MDWADRMAFQMSAGFPKEEDCKKDPGLAVDYIATYFRRVRQLAIEDVVSVLKEQGATPLIQEIRKLAEDSK